MATMTPEIKATIETLLLSERQAIAEYHYDVYGAAHRSETLARIDTALAWLQQQDAPQPDSEQDTPDALAAHWPEMPELEGIDRFSEYPVTGGSQDGD